LYAGNFCTGLKPTGTSEWDVFCEGFLLNFIFEDHWLDTIDDALQAIKAAIFKTQE